MTNDKVTLHADQFDKRMMTDFPTVILNNGSHYKIKMNGSILVYASQPAHGSLNIQQIERINLWTDETGPLPWLALSGPAPHSSWQTEAGQKGQISGIRFLLNYPELAQQEPVLVEEDAAFTPLEVMQGQLSWKPSQTGDFPHTQFELSLVLHPDHRVVGKIASIHFTLPELFILDDSDKTARAGQDEETKVMTLNLQFIKHSLPSGVENKLIEDWLRPWLQEVNTVWNRPGGIRVDVNDILGRIIPTTKFDFSNTTTCEATVDKIIKRDEVKEKVSTNCLNVFLTNTLQESPKGHTPPKPPWFVVLQIDDQNKNNPYLLAHELGHILRLSHPTQNLCYDSDKQVYRGADNSVMVPSDKNGGKNPSNNPAHNLHFWHTLSNAALLEMLKDPQPTDRKPDPEPWYLWLSKRPLQADYTDCSSDKQRYVPPKEGQKGETVVPLKELNEDPGQWSEDHICFRLTEYQLRNKPVQIYLYHRRLTPYSSDLEPILQDNPQLKFPNGWGRIRTCSLEWNVKNLPDGNHVIYAIIVDQNAPDDLKKWIKSDPLDNKKKLDNWADNGPYPYQNYVKKFEFTIGSVPDPSPAGPTMAGQAPGLVAASSIKEKIMGQKRRSNYDDYIRNCVASAAQEDDWTMDDAIAAEVISIKSELELPMVVDWSAEGWEIDDQEETGACVGFATAAVLRWHFVKAGKIGPKECLSARFIWMATKETDEFTSYPTTFLEPEGTSTKLALKIARKYGCVLEDDLSMKEGMLLSNLTRAQFYTKAAKLRIASYHNLGLKPKNWRRWLASHGPILIRLEVDESWDRATKTECHLQKYIPSQKKKKGHAACLVGYDHNRKFFIVRNSWGTDWGDNGFAYVSYKYAKAAFTEAYGIVVENSTNARNDEDATIQAFMPEI